MRGIKMRKFLFVTGVLLALSGCTSTCHNEQHDGVPANHNPPESGNVTEMPAKMPEVAPQFQIIMGYSRSDIYRKNMMLDGAPVTAAVTTIPVYVDISPQALRSRFDRSSRYPQRHIGCMIYQLDIISPRGVRFYNVAREPSCTNIELIKDDWKKKSQELMVKWQNGTPEHIEIIQMAKDAMSSHGVSTSGT